MDSTLEVPTEGRPAPERLPNFPASSPVRDASTHFTFQAKIFTVPGAYFALSKTSRESMYHLNADGMVLSVPLKTVRVEFGIAEESEDSRLLDIVDKGLRYVKEIRPGDSIPRELLDGTASWSIDEKHHNIAKNRLLMQVASWIYGDEQVIVDRDKLDQMVDDPAIKERIQNAFGAIAEKIGIGRDRKQEIVDKIEFFAREIAYIEALRDHYNKVRRIFANLHTLYTGIYKRDRAIAELLQRVLAYTKYPRTEFGNIFELIDAQTGEILMLLKNPDGGTKFVRDKRDELHTKLMAWEEIIQGWAEMPLERSMELEHLIQKTFRFLVERYLETNDWPDPNKIRGKRTS
ncbi:MAG TPA: hypothetical protein VEH84_11810 [Alphaproteobacteria bacterium]|nr:hypothetical protein [Alphaproteobacteria bacterium]